MDQGTLVLTKFDGMHLNTLAEYIIFN